MFTDQERQIFQYFDGKAKRWGDPIAIYERLQADLGGELHSIYEKATGQVTPDPEMTLDVQEKIKAAVMLQSSERLREAVRVAFEMAPWNPVAEKATETGATAADCDAALEAYLGFLDEQKKSGDPLPASSDASAA